ncbi:FxLYD domain-containing protein [Bifidobacterium catulorum]|uniref:Uncharacterized protein n=1 Tax=Bifidobacterium catulorum TaxID=1630173 RepID=A0A2U2MRB1_9BIFI|nr:FxLYD domain-containing protein [Bifidobacterium catulorum]PWG59369.1 hypothetical protein DF200_08080 [Bifidobacterium catulorum]
MNEETHPIDGNKPNQEKQQTPHPAQPAQGGAAIGGNQAPSAAPTSSTTQTRIPQHPFHNPPQDTSSQWAPRTTPTSSPYKTPQTAEPRAQSRTITLKLPAFIGLIVAIVAALVIGVVAGVGMSSTAIDDANNRAEASEADRQKIADAYDQVMSQIEQETQQQQKQSTSEQAIKVTGGHWNGDTYGTGYGRGVITVRNDGTKTLSNVGIVVAKLDAGGKVTGEANGQLQTALQPGQSADIDFMLDPSDKNVTHAQATTILYSLDKNGTDFTQYNITNAPKIAVK